MPAVVVHHLHVIFLPCSVGRCVRHEQRIHIFALPENAGAPDEEEDAVEQRLAALMT